MNIAIDGPSGAGKSTIAKLLAKELNAIYLDTGAMYRAIGLKVYNCGLNVTDEQGIQELLQNTTLNVVYNEGVQRVILDNEDVSDAIRQHHISRYASDVSKLKCVRLALVDMQRKICAKTDAVLDGRDIGTFVLPNADFKFYLTASLEERARRRHIELTQKGEIVDYNKIKEDIEQRDFNDMNRDFAPLKRAEDSIYIDSTFLSIQQACAKMLECIKGRD